MTRSLTCSIQERNLRVEILDGLDIFGFLNQLPSAAQEWHLVSERAREQVLLLLFRAQRGQLYWNRDVKRVKLIPDHLVFEFRIEIVGGDLCYPVRLIFVEKPDALGITIIGSHLKDPTLGPGAQRVEQNHAFRTCFQTYLEATSDNLPS